MMRQTGNDAAAWLWWAKKGKIGGWRKTLWWK